MGILENTPEFVIPDAVSESSYATDSTYVQIKPIKVPVARTRVKCRNGGRRGNIRANNASELERICGDITEEDSGIVQVDFNSESPFKKILENPDLYKTWQVFMSLSGSAQDRFINHLNKNQKPHTISSGYGSKKEKIRTEDSLGEEFIVIEENKGKIIEVKECDRIKEARERYLLIQKRVRNSMKKQGLDKVPFDVLEEYEKVIFGYFCNATNFETGIPLVINERDKYNRSWLYRLCDYHNLKSESIEQGDVAISCKKSKFSTPSIYFSEFLKMIL